METAEALSLLTTVVEVSAFLEDAGIQFLIGGSLASSLWGQERTIHDAVIAAFISRPQLEILERLVTWPYVMDARDLRSAMDSGVGFVSGQILHGESLDKIDLFVLANDEYSRTQIDNRRYVEVAPGHDLPFYSPEDFVIANLRWFVLGNRISDRQWNDVVQVLEMQDGQLDDAYLTRWSEHLGLTDLLSEARSQVVQDRE